ncbi:fumarylacetoacetate hydrolase family protein [Microvirga sp. 2YAF29]|uniref:fumarylacetoacetate hydrolase family protein n=1 Tax=Microvirga sp. 2YAF29 TaxID=3233031 RepID=UPI003F95A34A
MKLVRYGSIGQEQPGLIDKAGRVRSLSGKISDIHGPTLDPCTLTRLKAIDPESLPLVPEGVRLGACVGQVSKFVCVGLNYSDHATEAGLQVPAEPALFMKAPSSICGSTDNLILPRGSKKTDWEVELGIVIGRHTRYVTEADALLHVAGYCIVNDVSEREHQIERAGQWMKGKSADTFGPIGPWLVTADEVPDPQSLGLLLHVNGRLYQSGSTANMVFGVAFLVSYISQFMSLLPGDVIATGTPSGVGFGQKPPIFLKAGDHVCAAIDHLGTQNQRVVSYN